MINKELFNRLYWNPSRYTNEYERGISHGMMYMAEKLIWAEQYYLDARNKTNPKSMCGEKNLERTNNDMFKIINEAIQNFQERSQSWKIFSTDEQLKQYNDYINKIFN